MIYKFIVMVLVIIVLVSIEIVSIKLSYGYGRQTMMKEIRAALAEDKYACEFTGDEL